jgi:nucleoside-diphosphate-sugar epimerase
VLELARIIWAKIRGPEDPFRWVSDPAFEHDVERRVPAVDKSRAVLGFEATTSLEDMLDEVIPWVEQAMAEGRI